MNDGTTQPIEETTPEHPIESTPIEASSEMVGTPVENRAPANQHQVKLLLTDGRTVEGVRWFNADKQIWEYQVAIDGLVYDVKEAANGEYELL